MEMESAAVDVYFCFCAQTESKTTNEANEVGDRGGNPPPALVLSLRVAREHRRGSLEACARFAGI